MHTYQYTALYRVLGLSLPEGADEVQLVSHPEKGLTAVLSRDPDTRAAHVDRSRALAVLMLNGIFGQSKGQSLEAGLPVEISDQHAARKNQHGDGPYLIIQGTGTVDSLGTTPEATREFDTFIVSVGGVPSAQIRDSWTDLCSTVVAAVALSSGKPLQVDLLADGTVFLPEHGKPHHIFNMEAGAARAVVSSPITHEEAQEVQRWYGDLARHSSMGRVWRLLVLSLGFADDRLRAFMNSWSALEILVNKVFNEYSKLFFDELRSGEHPDVRKVYVDRISTVMKDKYRLADKFAIIASNLAPAEADADFAAFERLKSQRDALMHGQDVSESGLNAELTQQLAQKYLRLHLARS